MAKLAASLLCVILLSACSNPPTETAVAMSQLKQLTIPAPVAKRQDFTRKYHGQTLSDPYHWLRDPGYPEVSDQDVLAYLKQENAYFDAFMQPNADLVERLFAEFKGRTNETEESVPWNYKGFQYKWFYKSGAEYKTYSRKNLESGEETEFLDEEALAKGHDYFRLLDWSFSPDDRYLAYSINTSGDERYQIFILDMQTQKLLPDQLENVQGQVIFNDSNAVFYIQLDQDKWQANSINLHVLGTEQSQDKVLLSEHDDEFFLGMEMSSSQQYILTYSTQADVTEVHAIPLNQPASKPFLLASRDKQIKYSVDHANGDFYILANDSHKNFRLAKVSDQTPGFENWQTVIEGSDHDYLQSMQTFEDFIVLKARTEGIEQLRIVGYDGKSHNVVFPEPIFTVELGNNAEFAQQFVRLNYESMITPETVFDYELDSRSLVSKKVKKIPSGYDKNLYETRRIMAEGRDDVKIPVSIVYKKGYKQDKSHPLMLYGYGAYGVTVEPSFSTMRLSLLDRGFAYAIAHVRGSDMLGYQWYLDGKLEKRPNTFNDFIDVAKYLVQENYVAQGNISIAGRSAGGELMGAAVIQAPQMWRSAILGVPFVDVLNTMLDASLPLTPPEWQEWGNPINDPKAFELLKSYSPYDNIEATAYPPMLLSGGLNDPRVTYWEPAKFAAKMRANKTDDNLLIMRINMGAGHFAHSGRYGRLKDYAEEYTFTLKAHGISQ